MKLFQSDNSIIKKVELIKEYLTLQLISPAKIFDDRRLIHLLRYGRFYKFTNIFAKDSSKFQLYGIVRFIQYFERLSVSNIRKYFLFDESENNKEKLLIYIGHEDNPNYSSEQKEYESNISERKIIERSIKDLLNTKEGKIYSWVYSQIGEEECDTCAGGGMGQAMDGSWVDCPTCKGTGRRDKYINADDVKKTTYEKIKQQLDDLTGAKSKFHLKQPKEFRNIYLPLKELLKS